LQMSPPIEEDKVGVAMCLVVLGGVGQKHPWYSL
jgi:hypothetical protein